MFVQIEITTHCNYECFYCVGRDMHQEHMSFDQFSSIVNKLPNGMHKISLQGEGEPLTHPRFWDMVALIRDHGDIPYTITNGSRLDPQRIAEHFPSIGISIDTMDPMEAERIGRYKHAQMITGLESLLESYDPARIVIHTVNYGQDLKPVRDFVRAKGFGRHIIQPLQTKDDYAYLYQEKISLEERKCSYRCRYIEQKNMLFYNIAGIEMPCCFIKDTTKFVSTKAIRDSLIQHTVPACCTGCRELAA